MVLIEEFARGSAFTKGCIKAARKPLKSPPMAPGMAGAYVEGMRRIITALIGLSMFAGVASAAPHGGSRGGGGGHASPARGGGEHISRGGGEVRGGGGGFHGEVRGGGGGGRGYYGGHGYERGWGGAHYGYGFRPGWRYDEHFAYRAGYDWVGGDWYWDGAEWVWAPGHYARLRVW